LQKIGNNLYTQNYYYPMIATDKNTYLLTLVCYYAEKIGHILLGMKTLGSCSSCQSILTPDTYAQACTDT